MFNFFRNRENARFSRVCMAVLDRYDQMLATEEQKHEFFLIDSPILKKWAEMVDSVKEFQAKDEVRINLITGANILFHRDQLRVQRARLQKHVDVHFAK